MKCKICGGSGTVAACGDGYAVVTWCLCRVNRLIKWNWLGWSLFLLTLGAVAGRGMEWW